MLIDKSRPTTVKTRLIAQNNKHLARVDNESLEVISEDISKQIFANIEKVIKDVDLIILSDYLRTLSASFTNYYVRERDYTLS